MMKILVTLLVTLLTSALAARDHVTISGSARHVFSFFITPQYFNWTEDNDVRRGDQALLRYAPSLVGEPSLPPWLHYHFSEEHRSGLLYGVPERAGKTRLQVLATNRDTFETSLLYLTINIVKTTAYSGSVNHMKLKIDNLNIDDVFDKRRQDRLLDLFKTRFWTEAASDIHLTFADSALNLGGRRPLKPSIKDGVVIQLSSRVNFSRSLLDLDAETAPLRVHESCSYKRISVERHFRQSGFAVDWCSFRLTSEDLETMAKTATLRPMIESKWNFPNRSSLERRSRYSEIIAAIIVPILIFSLFTLGVGFLLWSDCGAEKTNKDIFIQSLFDVFEDCFKGSDADQQELLLRNNNIQATVTGNGNSNHVSRTGSPAVSHRDLRASSVQRQSETLRSLARRRDVTPRLVATPTMSVDGSSVHSRSRTGSPCPSNCGE